MQKYACYTDGLEQIYWIGREIQLEEKYLNKTTVEQK